MSNAEPNLMNVNENENENYEELQGPFHLAFHPNVGEEGEFCLRMRPSQAFSLMGLIFRSCVAKPHMADYMQRAVNRLRSIAHQIRNVQKDYFEEDDMS